MNSGEVSEDLLNCDKRVESRNVTGNADDEIFRSIVNAMKFRKLVFGDRAQCGFVRDGSNLRQAGFRKFRDP